MNIYVGNLSPEVTEQDLRQAFESFGATTKVAIIKDKDTHQPRGFAFVEMPGNDAAKSAISSLNGQDIKGKSITVNEARPRDDRSKGGRSSGGRGGFGGGNRGGGRSQRY